MAQKQTPKNWQEVELEEICEVLTGFAFKSSLFNEEGKGKPLIRIRDLLEGKSKTYYSEEFEEKYLVKKGDFLIGMDGEFKIFEWKSEDALLNQRVCKLILNKDLVFPKYIFYMISKELKEIEDKTPFVTVKHISNKQILSIKISIPPLQIQKQIVSILEKAEKLKQKREEADKKTKEYLQSVFYEMFGNPGGNTKKFLIKRGSDIFELAYGEGLTETNRDGGKYPVYGSNGKVGSHSNYLIKGPGIVVGRKGSIGKLNFVNENFWPIDTTYYIKLKGKTNLIFLFYLLKLFNLSSLNKSAAIPGLNRSDVYSINFIDPPFLLQQKFAKIVEQVEKLKGKQQKSKENIDELFNSLMQKAFNGELVR